MGNTKNSKNTHISRGKFTRAKRKISTVQKKLNGNRIISLHQLQHQVEFIADHTANCKSYNDIVERREGLASVFTIQCSGCNEKFTLPTSIKVKGPSGHQYWENNVAAVWGQMSTGGGHTTLRRKANRRMVVEPPPRINEICWKKYGNFTK